MKWHQHLSLTDHRYEAIVRHVIIYRQDQPYSSPLYAVIDQYGIELAQRFHSPAEAIEFLEKLYAKPAAD